MTVPGSAPPTTSRSTFVRNVVERVRGRGLRSSAVYSYYWMAERLQVARLGIAPAMQATQQLLSTEQLGIDGSSCKPYQPTASFHTFRAAMRRFVQPNERDVFLDYGSGLGRALVMAATYPFRRVIGVECVGRLNEQAAQIIACVKPRLACRSIDLTTSSAALFEVPRDVTVVYLFNPFGRDIFGVVLGRIERSLVDSPRKLTIVYQNPICEPLLQGCAWLRRLGEIQIPAICPTRTVAYRSDLRA